MFTVALQESVGGNDDIIPPEFDPKKDSFLWNLVDNRPFIRVLQGLAIAKGELGVYSEALRYYETLLHVCRGNDDEARAMIGMCYVQLGRHRDVISCYKKQKSFQHPEIVVALAIYFATQSVIPYL